MSMTVAELLADKARQSPNATLFTVAPDTGVAEAVSLMIDKAISSVIVADASGMRGLITIRELLAALNAHGGDIMKASCGDIMKSNPATTTPTETVDHLRTLMTELHITHVPVLKDGALAGILSFHDIARSAIKDVAFENQLLKQYIKNWPA
jgi:CBS domain-containing protein